MLTYLETLTLNGWHPDAGVWPIVAFLVLSVAYVVAPWERR